MKVLTAKQMKELDHFTMNDFGIESSVLMENAAAEAARIIIENHEDGTSVAVFCGSGNNGGDGFVIARWLHNYGFDVYVLICGKEDKMTPETKHNLELCRKLMIEEIDLTDHEALDENAINIPDAELIVDALFGIGFKGAARGHYKDLFYIINESSAYVYAVDIPSGINADTGEGILYVNADATITMAYPKCGLYLREGLSATGELYIVDIGIPPMLEKEFNLNCSFYTNFLKLDRLKFGHKGNFGRVAIIAGSRGLTGAAVLASKAALRTGSGLITLFHPSGLEDIFEIKLTEVMTKVIPEENDLPDCKELIELLSGYDCILIGPGIGVSEYSKKLTECILSGIDKPIIVDADGINIIASNPDLLLNAKSDKILLTPHIGEFRRLIKKDISDTISQLLNFTADYSVNVLLKSAVSIFSDGEVCMFEKSGNDGLSTGGSGDVLAGIIISYIGQGYCIKDAALSGSNLLGTTAEKLTEYRETASITPGDIVQGLLLKE